mgnify:CR=1 FL=1
MPSIYLVLRSIVPPPMTTEVAANAVPNNLNINNEAQPAQSALSAAVATVGGSGSLPVILRPDEVSEALKVGVNELLSLYGIH